MSSVCLDFVRKANTDTETASKQTFESSAGSQSLNTTSTVNGVRGNVSKTNNGYTPVVSVPAGTMTYVSTTDHISNSAAEISADDSMFTVQRTTDSGSQLQKVCEICGKVFQNYESFRSHKRMHASRHSNKQFPHGTQPCLHSQRSKTPLRLMCEICGVRGESFTTLARHMRTYHPLAVGIDNAGAPYQCTSCDEKFFLPRILRHHFRLVHSPTLPKKKTSWFRRQQRQRNGELPRCRYCFRYFGTRLALEAHERVHTGVKPYRCEVCGRCFRQTVHLTAHRRTHTNERPFACSMCQKAYKNRVDLRKHSSNKHGISLPTKRQRGVGGVDVIAAAVAAADIRPDDYYEI